MEEMEPYLTCPYCGKMWTIRECFEKVDLMDTINEGIADNEDFECDDCGKIFIARLTVLANSEKK